MKGCEIMKSYNKQITTKRKMVKAYIPDAQIEKLELLSEEKQKSVSAIITNLIEKELESLITLELQFDDKGEKL